MLKCTLCYHENPRNIECIVDNSCLARLLLLLQIEGAFMMGVGMILHEEVVVDDTSGRLMTDSTWTYKIPGVGDMPQVSHHTPIHASCCSCCDCLGFL